MFIILFKIRRRNSPDLSSRLRIQLNQSCYNAALIYLNPTRLGLKNKQSYFMRSSFLCIFIYSHRKCRFKFLVSVVVFLTVYCFTLFLFSYSIDIYSSTDSDYFSNGVFALRSIINGQILTILKFLDQIIQIISFNTSTIGIFNDQNLPNRLQDNSSIQDKRYILQQFSDVLLFC